MGGSVLSYCAIDQGHGQTMGSDGYGWSRTCEGEKAQFSGEESQLWTLCGGGEEKSVPKPGTNISGKGGSRPVHDALKGSLPSGERYVLKINISLEQMCTKCSCQLSWKFQVLSRRVWREKEHEQSPTEEVMDDAIWETTACTVLVTGRVRFDTTFQGATFWSFVSTFSQIPFSFKSIECKLPKSAKWNRLTRGMTVLLSLAEKQTKFTLSLTDHSLRHWTGWTSTPQSEEEPEFYA